ncbi:hypothetical protein WISP_63752 [Willisornis vidua]|uniref:GRF-type domain-containing protein n=1 Tax=Willisornis vidua TaxID=1566151 RepID=A0ABQ9DB00_9PASS|nr:hypothetical protein WISP_63752 [Willisornis vidua]
MASQEFTVLYTHQKTKKAKTWQDGVLKIRTGRNQGTLFDDKGQCLESIFIKSQVAAGDNLESERYLITIEAVKVSEKPLEDEPRKAEPAAVDRNGVKPALLPPRRLPVGLKRKFTGFQGPRQVEKKTPALEDEEQRPLLPLSRQGQGALPAQFYISSPLFPSIHKRDADTALPAEFQEGGCGEKDGEHLAVSSLLPAPVLGRGEGTEQPNSAQVAMKPQSPLLTGQTGPRAVSHNIRSTAQIIALLKAKPAQGHREQTSAATPSLSSFQASRNAAFCGQKSTALPALSGNPAKGLVPHIQPLPFGEGTVKDGKDWNAEMPLNSTEEPCGEAATGQRQHKKVNNLSQDLQEHCNTNSCFLPESTLSRMSDSQFVPSSGDISPSASPTTLENNPSGYREHSGTQDLRESSAVRMRSELQPQQNSEGVLSDPELCVDPALTEAGILQEEFSLHGKDCSPGAELMEVNFNLMETFDFIDTDCEDVCERGVELLTEGEEVPQSPDCSEGEDAAQSAAQRPHSCCEGVTNSQKEVKGSTLGKENDGSGCSGGVLSELCENRRIAEDSANQTRAEVELVGDGHNIREINASQLSLEATSNKEDLEGCAALTPDGTPWLRIQHSHLVLGDTNVKECHPEIGMLEATGSISGVSPSRVIPATDTNTAEGVTQPGCRKSPGAGSGHFWAPGNDDIPPGSPLLALSQKSDLSSGSPQCVAEGHQKLFGLSHKEDALNSMSSVHPLGTGHSTPEQTRAATELENAESRNASPEASRGEGVGLDCLKHSAVAENSSVLPDLVNDMALLRALTQHSTALESLQKMEENNSLLCEAETSKETSEPLVKDEAVKEFTEMPYPESVQESSCSYFESSGLMPNHVDSLFQKAEPNILPVAAAQGAPGTSDWQPKSPGSRSLHEDEVDVIRAGNFPVKSDVSQESGTNQSPLAFHVYPGMPPWTVSGSPPHSDLRQAQWTSWEPGKVSSELTPLFDPDSTISPASGNEETFGAIQEPLIHGILPSQPELPDCFFRGEKSSYPEECSFPGSKPPRKARTPFVTLPAAQEIPAVFYPTDREEVQQSLGSSGGNLCLEPLEFPVSAPGPEDRNSEPSVFWEDAEDEQREPLLPDGTSQCRQSKWLKYQNTARGDLIPANSEDREETGDICAQSILGMLLDPRAAGSAPLLPARSIPGECCANSTPLEGIPDGKGLPLHFPQAPLAAATQKVLSHLSCHAGTGEDQDITISELSFPTVDKVKHANLPKRKVSIPAGFQSHIHYKQVFKAALTEQLNILLFELSQRLHSALSKVDISFYTSVQDGQSQSQGSCVPLCSHMHPAKLVMVKKEGPNKGRLFYACDAPKAEQCSFFKWMEDVTPTQTQPRASAVLQDIKSIGTYLRSQKIALYEECQLLVRKAFEIQTQRYSKFKKFMSSPASLDGDSKPKLYLKLSKKEHSSFYSKDDIWVVSKTLNFEPMDTFIASSAFFGPSSNNEIELLPLKGYSPSNWRANMCVHALLVCNASGELASLRNMEEHFNPSTLPLIPYLLKMDFHSESAAKRVSRRKFTPPAMSLRSSVLSGPVSAEVALGLAGELIQRFSLNADQAAALTDIARMVGSSGGPPAGEGQHPCPITIIRGSGNDNEQLKELLALLKEDLTPAEKIYVRRSIEQHKLGTNKTILQQVKVVGVTCAACPFPCLNALRFPVVMLDECSQMTEPASLLPIARFQCEKLVLVGDPKQLPPTIQGSESVHEQGLEQTLFDRLCLMIQTLLSGVPSEAFEVKPVQVSTVDAFQGAEKEIIVLSCVRTRHFGFIDSHRRMNVALTRARRHLLIVGNLPCLSRNRLWGRVIHHCKGRENGLQNANQCEQQLNDILKCYLEEWKDEEQRKKKEK